MRRNVRAREDSHEGQGELHGENGELGIVGPQAEGAEYAPRERARYPTQRTATERRRLDTVQHRDALYRRPLAISDSVAFLGAIALGASVVGGLSLRPWALLGIPAMLLLGKVFGLYDRDENRLQKSTLEEVPGLLALATFVTLVVSLCDGAITDGRLTEPAILTIWVALGGLLVLGRVASRGFVDRLARPERCVLVGDPLTTADIARKVNFLDLNVEIVATLPAGGLPDPRVGPGGDAGDAFLRRVGPVIDLEHAHRVILASGPWPAEHLLHTVSDLMSSGVKVSVVPSTARLASLSYEVDQLPGMAMLGMKRFGISRSSQVIKRAFDLVVSSVALLLLSPLLAGIAIAIRLDSRGPALYRQRRIGKDGREFEMLKFRSMVAGAHQQRDELRHLNRVDGLFKIPEDPRVTRVGRVIRRRSLDELPQLLNVFRGHMSLVGPRPLVPAEDARIEGHFRHRLNVRPGITGPWQTLGAWRIPIQDMVVIDYLYAANWSLWTDLKLLARTIPFIASARGA